MLGAVGVHAIDHGGIAGADPQPAGRVDGQRPDVFLVGIEERLRGAVGLDRVDAPVRARSRRRRACRRRRRRRRCSRRRRRPSLPAGPAATRSTRPSPPVPAQSVPSARLGETPDLRGRGRQPVRQLRVPAVSDAVEADEDAVGRAAAGNRPAVAMVQNVGPDARRRATSPRPAASRSSRRRERWHRHREARRLLRGRCSVIGQLARAADRAIEALLPGADDGLRDRARRGDGRVGVEHGPDGRRQRRQRLAADDRAGARCDAAGRRSGCCAASRSAASSSAGQFVGLAGLAARAVRARSSVGRVARRAASAGRRACAGIVTGIDDRRAWRRGSRAAAPAACASRRAAAASCRARRARSSCSRCCSATRSVTSMRSGSDGRNSFVAATPIGAAIAPRRRAVSAVSPENDVVDRRPCRRRRTRPCRDAAIDSDAGLALVGRRASSAPRRR